MGLEELKTSIGMLLCAGWTLDDVLDMTLEQIGFVVESCMLYSAAKLSPGELDIALKDLGL